MKLFQQKEIKAAIEYATQGNQALHLHTLNQYGHPLFRKYKEIAHLFDNDAHRLRKTAYQLGVRVVKVERLSIRGQHIDLCGTPLEKAKRQCVVDAAIKSKSNKIKLMNKE